MKCAALTDEQREALAREQQDREAIQAGRVVSFEEVDRRIREKVA